MQLETTLFVRAALHAECNIRNGSGLQSPTGHMMNVSRSQSYSHFPQILKDFLSLDGQCALAYDPNN